MRKALLAALLAFLAFYYQEAIVETMDAASAGELSSAMESIPVDEIVRFTMKKAPPSSP